MYGVILSCLNVGERTQRRKTERMIGIKPVAGREKERLKRNCTLMI